MWLSVPVHFLPALAASWSDPSVPIWIDWPSDPMADWNARLNAVDSNCSSEAEAAVIEVSTAALNRADALGVISHRQKWATLGQCFCLADIMLNPKKLINVIPVAYDFPQAPFPTNPKRLIRL